ncbi:putative MFS family arabinose efflux permease [Paraburkholderia bryophila]|uniref:Putative MFS family arabinose efflux permease n=1 Tax=Paraburkholderia bryophila TaxID=420952 RepID=A0A329CKQ1_9BURK|nr:putative MFS family arabinose efflux permease [Paraburkholderia bryophila]
MEPTVNDPLSALDGLAAAAPRRALSPRYKAVASATAGSIIEGFDFIAYGTAAALVFNRQFFPNLDPTSATLASFGAFATGLFARPLGAVLFGHFGDRLGRKSTLMLSLFLMGFSTIAIGLIPNYAQIGTWSAVLLVVLRILQGIALGGEMGGAVLMAVEHAPASRAGLFGSLPQIGPPIGLLLSTLAFSLLTRLPEPAFQSWGWRVPFLASVVLVMLGAFVRRSVGETPVFEKAARAGQPADVPLWQLLTRHKKALLLAIGAKLPEVTLYYVLTVFLVSYASTRLGFSRTAVLQVVMLGAAIQIATLPLIGYCADRVGVRRFYLGGAVVMALCVVPLLRWIDSGSLVALQVAVAIALGLNYPLLFGPQSALFAAQFPVAVRFSGISIGIQFAAAIGGGLAPIVATALVTRFHSLQPVALYVGALAALAALCTRLMKNVPSAQTQTPTPMPTPMSLNSQGE